VFRCLNCDATFDSASELEKCPVCGGKVIREKASVLTEEERKKIEEEEKYRAEVRRELEDIIPQKSSQSLGLAYVLNLILPGAGHLYLGKVGTGIVMFIVALVGLAMAGVPTIIVWIYGLATTRSAYEGN